MRALSLFLFLFVFAGVAGYAQGVRGTLTDAADGRPLTGVNIQNAHTGETFTTDSTGRFFLAAAGNHLLEFRRLGYTTLRLRIPPSGPAPYYRLSMAVGAFELAEVTVRDRALDPRTDSLKQRELYGRALDFPQMTGLDWLANPFWGLSKTNRKYWAFQREFNEFQKIKYVDYQFNERIVYNITGLSADSAARYIPRYKPTYERLQSMTDYERYAYIRQTVERFRRYGR